jgi:hypothetical protein
MYELFGSTVDQTNKTVTFKLFLPDAEIAPDQYDGGGLPANCIGLGCRELSKP